MLQTEIAVFEMVVADENFDFSIPCESEMCRTYLNPHSHPAQWHVIFSDGSNMFWCNDRLQKYHRDIERGVDLYNVQTNEQNITVIHITPVPTK